MLNDNDRKKVFWLHKKYSSYTAWKNLGDTFRAFTDAWEYAVKKDKDQDEFDTIVLKRLWKGCAGFERGLPLLKHGERHVFRYKMGGDLGWHALDSVFYARKIMNPREYDFDWMANKDQVLDLWDKTELALNGLSSVSSTEEIDSPAPGTEFFFDSMFEPFNFPQQLPTVPAPTDLVINSGDAIPCDGIWEPEWTVLEPESSKTTGILRLFTPNTKVRLDKGCMNYFVSGVTAPRYRDARRLPIMPVRWRLIWEDTRYRDGIIPDEEAEYLAPKQETPAQSGYNPSHRVEGGKPCPQTGFWFTPALADSRLHFYQGDTMPVFEHSQYGATIWQWDTNQTK